MAVKIRLFGDSKNRSVFKKCKITLIISSYLKLLFVYFADKSKPSAEWIKN
jgi:hypothetical protein